MTQTTKAASEALVSVALCTYNGARFIGEQLQSLERQTVIPDEVIVCDDASTDDTRATIEAFAQHSSLNITLHSNTRNVGYKANFANAIRMTQGEFVFLCDQDDVWHPAKIETYLNVLRGNPRNVLVFGNANVVDANMQSLGGTLWGTIGADAQQLELMRSVADFGYVLARGFPLFYGFTMAFRRSLMDLLLPIPVPFGHDRWIGTIASAVGFVDFVATPLHEYRQHSAQTTGSRKPSVLQRLQRTIGYVKKLGNPMFYENVLKEDLFIRDRLQGISNLHPGVMADLESKIAYSRARAETHRRPRLLRLPIVLRELRSGGYARFARSQKTVLVDLFL